MLGRAGWVAAAVALLGCSGTPSAQIDLRPPPAEDAAPSPDAGPLPDDAAATLLDALPTLDAAPDAPAVDWRIYVAPTGSDTADGTRAHPLASIGAAAVAAHGGAVLVCAGTYPAGLTLDARANGVTLSGGFDCATWQPGSVTTVAPPSGYALTIDGATNVTLEDLRFVAADATTPGGSSIAAYVTQSSGITLRRVTAIGGKGATGASGTTPTADLLPPIPGTNAAPAPFTSGGQGPTVHCLGGDSVGGSGGTGQMAGGVGLPLIAENAGQTGGTCTPGTRGQDGAPVIDGPGATTLGDWLTGAWRPAGGISGNAGHTGQGGGGGGGVAGLGNGGGSGGTGGCGGAGGPAGGGGGASFGLVVDHAAVRVESCALVSGQAGAGGAGAAGQAGELGAGPGSAAGFGCHGGEGGSGARGGTGGGGAGGTSAALVFAGESPTSDGLTTFTTGTAGVRGIGGTPSANDGKSGEAKTTLVLP